MNGAALQNATPHLKEACPTREADTAAWDDEVYDEVDAR